MPTTRENRIRLLRTVIGGETSLIACFRLLKIGDVNEYVIDNDNDNKSS